MKARRAKTKDPASVGGGSFPHYFISSKPSGAESGEANCCATPTSCGVVARRISQEKERRGRGGRRAHVVCYSRVMGGKRTRLRAFSSSNGLSYPHRRPHRHSASALRIGTPHRHTNTRRSLKTSRLNAHFCRALSNVPGLCRDSFCSPQLRSQWPGIASVYRHVPIQSLRGESEPDVSDTDRNRHGTLHASIHMARAVFGLAAGYL
jgi:hypothetical protein